MPAQTRKQEDPGITLPQVFAYISDPLLQNEYSALLTNPRYCLVWHAQTEQWKSALGSLESTPYEIGVLDLSLFPEPIPALKSAVAAGRDIEWIILAPDDNFQTALEAFRLGITDYFPKPVSPEALTWAVEKRLAMRSILTAAPDLMAARSLFMGIQYLHATDNESSMRETASRLGSEILGTEIATAVLLSGPPPSQIQFVCPHPFLEAATASLAAFRQANPSYIEQSFERRLGGTPPKWPVGSSVWIPLKSVFQGGLYFGNVAQPISPTTLNRLEYLVRNLETALGSTARQKDIKQVSYVDELTGLFNKRYLDVALAAAFVGAKQRRKPFSVLFMEVEYTHQTLPNPILKEVSTRLKAVIRRTDLLFHYGGIKLVAVLQDTEAPAALDVAKRLCQSLLEKHFYIQGQEHACLLNVCTASYPAQGKDREAILKVAARPVPKGISVLAD